VDSVTSRGEKLSKGFTAHDRNVDINVGMAALKGTFDVTPGGLYQGEIFMLRLGQSRAVICCWPSPAQSFLVSGPYGTHYHIFVLSKFICVFRNGAYSSTTGRVGLSV
jgi:hypothetical protein